MTFKYWYMFPLVLVPFLFKRDVMEVNISSFKVRNKFKFLEYILYLSFVLSILALMRPQVIRRVGENIEGINIGLVLDMSGSMQLEDIRPSRIEAAKSVMLNFIDKRINDKISLTIFGEVSLPKVPGTLDHKVLKEKIKELNIGDIPPNGTDLGRGLMFSLALLKNVERSKIVILLTDGSDTSGTSLPLEAAELAKSMNVRVYTIGVGATSSSDIFGHIFSSNSIDEELLKKISHITSGKYFRASSFTVLEDIFDEIDKIERSDIKRDEYSVDELYLYFLLPSLILLIIFMIIGEVVWTQI